MQSNSKKTSRILVAALFLFSCCHPALAANIKIKDGEGIDVYLKASGAGTDTDPHVVTHSTSATGTQRVLFHCKMDLTGDGTGSKTMNVDGSTTAVTFKVKPATGKTLRVSRIILLLRDGGSFDSGGWGNNGGTPLTTGIQFQHKINNVTTDFTDHIQSHSDMAGNCHDIAKLSWGAGDEFLTARWTLVKMGQYLRLSGTDGDEFHLVVNDDLTYLSEMAVTVQGYYE